MKDGGPALEEARPQRRLQSKIGKGSWKDELRGLERFGK